MTRFLLVIGSLAISAVAIRALSQGAELNDPADMKSYIEQEIEHGAPTETTGITSSVLGGISLEAYSASLSRGEFRAREVVLLPGARIAIHAHDRHPAIVYLLEGEVVEHRNDSKEPIIRREGDTYFEGPGVVHWLENVSPNRARGFSVAIVPHEVE